MSHGAIFYLVIPGKNVGDIKFKKFQSFCLFCFDKMYRMSLSIRIQLFLYIQHIDTQDHCSSLFVIIIFQVHVLGFILFRKNVFGSMYLLLWQPLSKTLTDMEKNSFLTYLKLRWDSHMQLLLWFEGLQEITMTTSVSTKACQFCKPMAT